MIKFESFCWCEQYIQRLLSLEDEGNAFLIKALGEYLLFTSILTEKQYVDFTSSSKLKIKNFIDQNKISNFDRLKLKFYFNTKKENKQIIEDLWNRDHSKLTLEQAYLLEKADANIEDSYWKKSILLIFQDIYKNSFTNENLYNLTHWIFFSTSFGQKRACFITEHLSTIHALLEKAIIFAREDFNWDLYSELLLGLLYMGFKLDKSFYDDLRVVQSAQGWYLSNGYELEYYERNCNNLNYKQMYSLFHTSLIVTLLHIEVEKN